MDLVVDEQFYHPMVEKFVYQPEAKRKTDKLNSAETVWWWPN